MLEKSLDKIIFLNDELNTILKKKFINWREFEFFFQLSTNFFNRLGIH